MQESRPPRRFQVADGRSREEPHDRRVPVPPRQGDRPQEVGSHRGDGQVGTALRQPLAHRAQCRDRRHRSEYRCGRWVSRVHCRCRRSGAAASRPWSHRWRRIRPTWRRRQLGGDLWCGGFQQPEFGPGKIVFRQSRYFVEQDGSLPRHRTKRAARSCVVPASPATPLRRHRLPDRAAAVAATARSTASTRCVSARPAVGPARSARWTCLGRASSSYVMGMSCQASRASRRPVNCQRLSG